MGGYGFEGVGETVDVYSDAVVHGLQAEAGQVSHVVEVSVGQEDGPQSILFVGGQGGHEAASVDGEGAVYEKAGVLRMRGLHVVSAKDADFHFSFSGSSTMISPSMIADWGKAAWMPLLL